MAYITSWWKLIVANTGAANSSKGAYAKRVANKLNAQNFTGHNWEQKVGDAMAHGGKGSFGRRIVDFSKPLKLTAYGTAGSYGRQIYNQNLIAPPAGGAHSVTPPAGGFGVH